ncbi:MAG: hypothetical protein GTO18_09215 [Anaerolineales bacterium]|nr:hypothetical protein [Anaerolineales bacterium]
MQTESLSHEQSLLQLPFRGNCMNWVLGHTLVDRNSAVKILGGESFLADDEIAIYVSCSEPVTHDSGSITLEQLLEHLDRSLDWIEETLSDLTSDDLDKEVESGGRKDTVDHLIAGLHWHETYRTGQLEILRQLAGKDDKVI